MDIHDVIKGFSLETKELEAEKEDVLHTWKNYLDPTTFDIFLKLCSCITYYSQKRTAKEYINIYNSNLYRCINQPKKNPRQCPNVLYLPYRKKDDHTETSVGMFTIFINSLDINTFDTADVLTIDKIKEISDIFSGADKIVEEKEKLTESDSLLKNTSENNSATKKSIKRKKRSYQAKIGKLEKQLETITRPIIALDYIVIVDDFIGSGCSVINLLKKADGYLKNLDKHNINICFVCLEGSELGMKNIDVCLKELNINNFGVIKKRIAYDMSKKQLPIWTSENASTLKRIISSKKYNFPRPSNYCTNAALASFMNAPNNNVSIISTKTDTWTPIFERKKRSKTQREKQRTDFRTFEDFKKSKLHIKDGIIAIKKGGAK